MADKYPLFIPGKVINAGDISYASNRVTDLMDESGVAHPCPRPGRIPSGSRPLLAKERPGKTGGRTIADRPQTQSGLGPGPQPPGNLAGGTGATGQGGGALYRGGPAASPGVRLAQQPSALSIFRIRVAHVVRCNIFGLSRMSNPKIKVGQSTRPGHCPTRPFPRGPPSLSAGPQTKSPFQHRPSESGTRPRATGPASRGPQAI